MQWAGMQVVVTGGAGFIGSHLSASLHDLGAEVTIVDDLSTGIREIVPDGLNFVEGCITDSELMSRVMEGKDALFHLAAIASVPRCDEYPVMSQAVNEVASRQILNIAECPVVFASSAAIYGEPIQIPIDENHPISPVGNYGQQKAAVDEHIRGCGDSSTPATALRFFNVYGSGQDPSSQYSGVLSIFIDGATTAGGVTIFGDGEQTRDFVHVNDVVAACITAAESLLSEGTASPAHAQAFNVCTGRAVTLNELVATIEGALGRPLKVTHSSPRSGDVRHSHGSATLLRATLGWEPKVTLPEGIASLIEVN